MDLDIPDYRLRALVPDDAPALTRHADDPEVARNLRDRFPHPYAEADALTFIAMVRAEGGEQAWAVDRGGEAVGVIGAVPGTDVYRGSWEIGYWLGRDHWGRGVATAAVRAVTAHLFAREEARRVWAPVFASNPASARVLEKADFRLEGTHRARVHKRGEILDEWVYARLRDDPETQNPAV